MSQVYT